MDEQTAKIISRMQGEIDRLKAIELPAVWTGWTDFTCTLTGSGGSAGTYAEDLAYARFTTDGKRAIMTVRKRITNLGSWTGDVRLSYPVNRAGSHGGVVGGGYIGASAGAVASPKAILSCDAGSFARFYKTFINAIQWADLAINDYILINVTYEV